MQLKTWTLQRTLLVIDQTTKVQNKFLVPVHKVRAERGVKINCEIYFSSFLTKFDNSPLEICMVWTFKFLLELEFATTVKSLTWTLYLLNLLKLNGTFIQDNFFNSYFLYPSDSSLKKTQKKSWYQQRYNKQSFKWVGWI